MDHSTIVALATPIGSAGIGIIKISGKDALSIASSIFRKSDAPVNVSQDSDPRPISSFKSHHLYHGHILDSESGVILDEVLLAAMLAPHSYTREDVVEINTHSGYVVLSSILNLVLKRGAILAAPGEFTKRAYLNGRIDLTQAEAVIDIINARTSKSLEIANAHLKGDLRTQVESVRRVLSRILAEVDAGIDFPEDVGEIVLGETAVEIIQGSIIAPLKELIHQHNTAHIFRDGLKMAVVGRPNVGKSSLMNRLIQKDRVIVSPLPGTTRDLIEETLNIRGIPVIVTDTAGLHETEDPVEVLGINKTREYIQGSDLILFMVEASGPLTADDCEIFEQIKEKNIILVKNKMDLVTGGFCLNCPDSWAHIPSVQISALLNTGLEDLKKLIANVSLGTAGLDTSFKIIPNLRHNLLLESALQAVSSAVQELRTGDPLELIAIDFQEAIHSLDEILGITAREDVLDNIFSRFCVGK